MRPTAMLAASHFWRPLPAPGEVHLWCLFPEDIRDFTLMKVYEGLLSCDEKKKVSECSNARNQAERLLARTLVRTTLARYTGGRVDASALRFSKNNHGKPKVIWPVHVKDFGTWRPPSLCFNLSHTESLLACAVTLNTPVGIDVEERDRKLSRNLMALARRRFSPEEADWLAEFRDPTEQHDKFMQLWTLKEAYVKALGTGIHASPLKEFSFGITPSLSAQTHLQKVVDIPADAQAITMKYSDLAQLKNKPGLPANSWQFLLLQPSPLHVASICTFSHQSGVSEEDQTEGGSENHFRLKIWRTVPLVGDEPLTKEAVALGISLHSNQLSALGMSTT